MVSMLKNDSIVSIHPMMVSDLSDVCKIQQRCYHSSYWEDVEIFAEKIDLFPCGCFVAFVGDLCGGYIFSHPWIKDKAVPLNSLIYPLPSVRCSYYLHDCSVDPMARGKGIGEKLVKEVMKTACHIGANNMQLVSVQQSQNYWGRFGFVTLKDLSLKSNDCLENYSTDAVMMSLTLKKID